MTNLGPKLSKDESPEKHSEVPGIFCRYTLMRLFAALVSFLISLDVSAANRLSDALEILIHVPTGKTLVQKALGLWNLQNGEELMQVLKWGPNSRTDAVLTRHFNPKTGEEVRERQVTVYLKRDQNLEDLVLDLAHELVHATSRPGWDPYDPALTAGIYVRNAIEGAGGEVEALVAECQVGFELATRFGASAKRCESYVSQARSSGIDRLKVTEDFYRVGKWSRELSERLGQEVKMFPKTSSATPRLYSSTGNAPYPIALLKEFEDITEIACRNTRRRTPASEASQFIAKRCK